VFEARQLHLLSPEFGRGNPPGQKTQSFCQQTWIANRVVACECLLGGRVRTERTDMRAQSLRQSDAIVPEAAGKIKLLANPASHLQIAEIVLAAKPDTSFLEQLNERATRRTRVLEEILSQSQAIVSVDFRRRTFDRE
jgi:hypothetical protein